MARVALESLYRLLWVYMIRIKCESNTATQRYGPVRAPASLLLESALEPHVQSLHGLFAFLAAYPIPVKTRSELMVPARPQPSKLHHCLRSLCQSISLRQD